MMLPLTALRDWDAASATHLGPLLTALTPLV
jgi:hypothetical protein